MCVHRKKFVFYRGERRSNTIWRITKELKETNKNYKIEGNVVLAATKLEKDLVDRFLLLKDQMHFEFREVEDPQPGWYLWAPPLKEAESNKTCGLQNWQCDVARRCQIDKKLKFNSTAYRKALRTKWATEVSNADQQDAINRHFGHLATTAYRNYCFNNKAKNAIVSNMVRNELEVSFLAHKIEGYFSLTQTFVRRSLVSEQTTCTRESGTQWGKNGSLFIEFGK